MRASTTAEASKASADPVPTLSGTAASMRRACRPAVAWTAEACLLRPTSACPDRFPDDPAFRRNGKGLWNVTMWFHLPRILLLYEGRIRVMYLNNAGSAHAREAQRLYRGFR